MRKQLSKISATYINQLKGLADEIEHSSNNRINAKVMMQTIEGISICNIMLCPRGRPASAYELLQFRFENMPIPSVIETFHTKGSLRLVQIKTEQEFQAHLQRLIQYPRTKKILKLIAEEALEKELHGRRFIVSDRPFKHEQGDIVQVSILGVSGFLSSSTLQRLVKKPDEEGSAYQAASEGFVAGFKFEGEVRVALNHEEMEILRKAARKAMLNLGDN